MTLWVWPVPFSPIPAGSDAKLCEVLLSAPPDRSMVFSVWPVPFSPIPAGSDASPWELLLCGPPARSMVFCVWPVPFSPIPAGSDAKPWELMEELPEPAPVPAWARAFPAVATRDAPATTNTNAPNMDFFIGIPPFVVIKKTFENELSNGTTEKWYGLVQRQHTREIRSRTLFEPSLSIHKKNEVQVLPLNIPRCVAGRRIPLPPSPSHSGGPVRVENVEYIWVVIPREKVMSTKRYTTMVEAIDDLKKRGFTANFEFLGQAFRDVDSGRTFKADDLTIVEHYRFEGASDPDDTSVVYAIKSHDGTTEIIADAFGVYASPGLGRFLEQVKIREGTWKLPSLISSTLQ
jgi:hypothetical protein